MIARTARGGPIAWMARNSVAANLLMAVLIFGGLYMMTKVKQEYLPNTDADTVTVNVTLPGATPAEVEQSIVLALEDAISSVQGIDKISSNASEGSAALTIELSNDRSRELVFGDIQQAVDGVTSLPDDAEEPVVRLSQRRRAVLDVQIFGAADPLAIRMAAEHVRSALLAADGISQVDIENQRDLVYHIEIPEAALRAHDLTIRDVAATIRSAALDRAGGTIETSGGDLLLRLADRREDIREFARIAVVTDRTGTVVRLGDIATLRRGFDDGGMVSTFDRQNSIELRVRRVGDETPITVSQVAREVLPDAVSTLPSGIDYRILSDRSEYYKGRMDLLTKNGLIGLALVLILLTLFLEIKLAFWVAVGIPTAFMGTLLILPVTDQSINLVSMFAFILALGIVVDDAIVAGENIYEYRQQGVNRLDAAIQGARDIAVPLSFSILTNIVALIPLALMPGWMGKLWFVIPIVVSLAFIMSWVEALFILPAHLSGHERKTRRKGVWAVLAWLPVQTDRYLLKPVQFCFAGGLAWFTRWIYAPVLRLALNARYVTVALMVAVLMTAIAWVESGRMGWGLFPPVPRDFSKALLEMPVGTPEALTLSVRDQVVAAAGKGKGACGKRRRPVGRRRPGRSARDIDRSSRLSEAP